MKKTILLVAFLIFGMTAQLVSQNVYCSAKGEKYHTADCKLSGDADGMTLAAAKKAGKTGCGMCKPDLHLKAKLTQCKGKTGDGTGCKRMTSNKAGKCFQHMGK